MDQPEKRRGTGEGPSGSGGGNMLRTADSMPAMPPRAAVCGVDPSGADELVDGGAPLTELKETGMAGEEGGGAQARAMTSSSRDQPKTDAGQVVREKDERIAFLEEEMRIMEREFQQELDKLSQTESETATFWQSRHSALNQQFLRTDTELRLLRREVEVREAECEELRQGVEVLRGELRERDEEIRRLRSQVRGLKEFVSTSTRTDDQTSDEVFGDGMTKLGNGLQNWVISNFRKVKIDLTKVSKATRRELNELVPMYEEVLQQSKVHLLQSMVSRVLVEMVFDAYYVGLSEEETRQFEQMEQLLTRLCPSSEPINQWRSTTLSLLRRQGQEVHDATDSFAECVMVRITSLLASLTGGSAPGLPAGSSADGLRVLVKNSMELARLVVVQKARLRVYMPRLLAQQRVVFDAETMEDVGGEDEEALGGRSVVCVVFPGVVKHGDENGGNAQYTNIIAKSKVLCGLE